MEPDGPKDEAGRVPSGPEDAAPEDAAPEDAAPEDAAPEDAAPEDAGGKKRRRPARSRFEPGAVAGMRLEERDQELLCDLFWQRAMSRGQLQRLYFSSLVRANARLRLLFDHGFVTRHFLPAAPYGAQAVYSLGRAAVPTVARALELEEDEVKRACRFSGTPAFLEHTLSVAEVRLAFSEACAAHPDLELERWVPEPLCRHEYEAAPPSGTGAWRREIFKPDGFLRLHQVSSGQEWGFFLEADLGHTSARQFAGKVAMHEKYLQQGLFGEIYGGEGFQTLVVTTGARRIGNLLALCREMGSGLFRFTTFEWLEKSGPLAAIWYGPSEDAVGRLCS